MTKAEAIQGALQLSLENREVKSFVIQIESEDKEGFDFTRNANTDYPIIKTFFNGEVLNEEGKTKSKKKMAKTASKKAVKKVAAKKEKTAKVKTIIRGNNMALTAEDWKKVDAHLKTLNKGEGESFSAFSKSLVRKAVGL